MRRLQRRGAERRRQRSLRHVAVEARGHGMHGDPKRARIEARLAGIVGGARGAQTSYELIRRVRVPRADERDTHGQHACARAQGAADGEVDPVGKVEILRCEFVRGDAEDQQVNREGQHQSHAPCIGL